jgi:hypothetical protein
MATIHTLLPEDVPGHHGEYVVGQILKEFSNPGLELWFNINYIAGITDLDLILLDNQTGYYLVEIKSMKIDAIQEFTNSTFILKTNEEKKHPVTQLRTGSLKLRDYLKRISKFNNKQNLPFIQSTVLWSEITRSQWKSRFNESGIKDFEEMCIFKDDLSSYNSLVVALQKLWSKPILGVNVPMHAQKIHGDVDEFRKALSPGKHKVEISRSMSVEIARPVKESLRVADKYPPGRTYRVSLQGAPGTGKTTILREIGLANLAAGAKVLHVCFNKVLAADQKREYQILRKNIEEYGFIDVFDIWELYKVLGHTGGISTESNIVENVTNFLAGEEGGTFIKYDVVLIDESQDLRDDFFQVVRQIARPEASWFIAYGKGQETNNFRKDELHPSPWLTDFLLKADSNHLRRSFRNSTKAFLIAQAFWEEFPNLKKAKDWLNGKFSTQKGSHDQFELDLELPQTKNDFKVVFSSEGTLKRASIRSLLLNAIEDAQRADRGEDLLVAVIKPPSSPHPTESGAVVSSYEIVKEVLEEISEELGVDFHDLVPADRRRDIPKIGAIRLVTLQGIRGLSASHVVIFDLSQLERWAKIAGGSMKPPLVNLGYIALSRSKASTIVVLNQTPDSEVESFLLEMLNYSTSLALSYGKSKVG